MKKVWAVTAAAVLVLVGIGLVVWSKIASGVPAGTVIHAYALEADSQKVQVEVPGASYVASVTRPLSSLPHDLTATLTTQRDQAEEGISGGGRFVGLDLASAPDQRPSTALAVGGSDATFAVVADGKRYPLPSVQQLIRPDFAVYVALPSDPRRLDLDVTVDGMTQQVDLLHVGTADHGAAAAYYDAPTLLRSTTGAAECLGARVRLSAGQLDPGSDSATIHFEMPQPIVGVPYVAGLGWAATGRTWLVVPITTRFNQGTFVTWPRVGAPREVLYLPRLRRTTVRVDGRTPRSTVAYYVTGAAALASSNVSGRYYVFDVARTTHTLRFSQLYADRLHRDDRPAPAGAPERVTGRVSCAFGIS